MTGYQFFAVSWQQCVPTKPILSSHPRSSSNPLRTYIGIDRFEFYVQFAFCLSQTKKQTKVWTQITERAKARTQNPLISQVTSLRSSARALYISRRQIRLCMENNCRKYQLTSLTKLSSTVAIFLIDEKVAIVEGGRASGSLRPYLRAGYGQWSYWRGWHDTP